MRDQRDEQVGAITEADTRPTVPNPHAHAEEARTGDAPGAGDGVQGLRSLRDLQGRTTEAAAGASEEAGAQEAFDVRRVRPIRLVTLYGPQTINWSLSCYWAIFPLWIFLIQPSTEPMIGPPIA